jgi:hypothetical protein
MGLDMSLMAKRYLNHSSESAELDKIANAFLDLPSGYEIRCIEVEAVYWRRAWPIHRWFVENIQDGEDDCAGYHVSHSKLQILLNLVREILLTGDVTLLPPTKGGTEADDVYWYLLESTEEQLTKVLQNFNGNWYFKYRSSW